MHTLVQLHQIVWFSTGVGQAVVTSGVVSRVRPSVASSPEQLIALCRQHKSAPDGGARSIGRRLWPTELHLIEKAISNHLMIRWISHCGFDRNSRTVHPQASAVVASVSNSQCVGMSATKARVVAGVSSNDKGWSVILTVVVHGAGACWAHQARSRRSPPAPRDMVFLDMRVVVGLWSGVASHMKSNQ